MRGYFVSVRLAVQADDAEEAVVNTECFMLAALCAVEDDNVSISRIDDLENVAEIVKE